MIGKGRPSQICCHAIYQTDVGTRNAGSSGDSTIAWCCVERQDLQAIYAPHHLSMYSQNSNLTPAAEAGPHLHPGYVPMHPFWGQLPSEVFESDHVWLALQTAEALAHARPWMCCAAATFQIRA